MYKWGNNLPTNGNIFNSDNLLNWWKSTEPSTWQFYAYKNFNSWEAILAQYYTMTNQYINYLKKINSPNSNSAINLRAFLTTNNKYLEMIIFNLKKTNQEKIYLINLNDAIYDSLTTKLVSTYISTDPHIIGYSLEKIINEKEFGFYDVSFTNDNLPQYFKNKIEIRNSNKFSTIFNNVKIDRSINSLLVKIPNINLIEKENWYRKDMQEKNNYKYYLNFSSPVPNRQYLISAQYKINQPIILQLESSSSTIILNELILPHDKIKTFLYSINIPISSDIKSLKFIITSGEKMYVDDLNSLKLKIQPLFLSNLKLIKRKALSNNLPKITYEQKNNFQQLIKISKTTSEQDYIIMSTFNFFDYFIKKKVITPNSYYLEITPAAYFCSFYLFWFYVLAIFFIIFSNYFYGLIIFLRNRFKQKNSTYHLNQLLFHEPRFPKIQYFVVILIILLLSFDILFVPTYFFYISLLIFILYVFGIIITNYKFKISLIFPSILAILIIFFLFFKMEDSANKTAFWLHVFLIIYLFQTIITLNIKKQI